MSRKQIYQELYQDSRYVSPSREPSNVPTHAGCIKKIRGKLARQLLGGVK